MPMETKLAELKTRLAEGNDLNRLAAAPGWDRLRSRRQGGAPQVSFL